MTTDGCLRRAEAGNEWGFQAQVTIAGANGGVRERFMRGRYAKYGLCRERAQAQM